MGVSAVENNYLSLKAIALLRCIFVSDIGVSAIGNKCPFFKGIYHHCCSKFIDIGVSGIAHKSLDSNATNLYSSNRITDLWLITVLF